MSDSKKSKPAMRIFLNTVYSLLLFFLTCPLWVGVGASILGGARETDQVQAIDNLQGDDASQDDLDKSFLAALFFCCLPLSILQLARLKFDLLPLHLFTFVISWPLSLLLLLTSGDALWGMARHSIPFAAWVACFFLLVPSFGLLWWDKFIRFERHYSNGEVAHSTIGVAS